MMEKRIRKQLFVTFQSYYMFAALLFSKFRIRLLCDNLFNYNNAHHLFINAGYYFLFDYFEYYCQGLHLPIDNCVNVRDTSDTSFPLSFVHSLHLHFMFM